MHASAINNSEMGRKGWKKTKNKLLCYLCLSQWKASCSKTLFGIAPRSEGGKKAAAMPHYRKATIAVPWWLPQLSQQPLFHLVFECVCLCGGVNKSQQISPWATSEISLWWLLLKRDTSLRTAQWHQHLFPAILHCCWVQVGSNRAAPSPRRRCFLPLHWCFNNLHSNVISKLASIVSYGLLCAIKLDSNLSKSSVVWEPVPAKVMCWEKNKGTEITVALQPWMLYQLGNNRERGRGKLGPLFASLGLEVEITCMLCFR